MQKATITLNNIKSVDTAKVKELVRLIVENGIKFHEVEIRPNFFVSDFQPIINKLRVLFNHAQFDKDIREGKAN